MKLLRVGGEDEDRLIRKWFILSYLRLPRNVIIRSASADPILIRSLCDGGKLNIANLLPNKTVISRLIRYR